MTKIKFYLFLSLLIVTFSSSFSQSKYSIGRITTSKGDSLYGYIKDNGLNVYGSLIGSNVKFKTDLVSSEVKKFNRNEIKDIYIGKDIYRNIKYSSYEYSSYSTLSKIMKLVVDGELKIYETETVRTGNGGNYYVTKYYIGNENNSTFQIVKKSGFKNMILNFIKDDQKLYNSLMDKKLKKDELFIIVEIYNRHIVKREKDI